MYINNLLQSERKMVSDELHARPYVRYWWPAHVVHLSFSHDEAGEPTDLEGVELLVSALKMTTTYSAPRHSIHTVNIPDLGTLVVSWARHTNYTSYTLFLYDLKIKYQPFGFDVLTLLPAGWLDARTTGLLVATRLDVATPDMAKLSFEQISTYFENHTVNGSLVMSGQGLAWSCYRIHSDGFGRLLLIINDMSRHELGRTTQRLLNIEDYYHMTLLALPIAKQAQPSLTKAERQLNRIMQGVSKAETLGEQREQLDALTNLAVEIERELALVRYRFAPASAYFALLQSSFIELREEKISGVLPLSLFVLRRVKPAANTYANILDRLESMSVRISRATNLLRTAIELKVEEQNQRLLKSVDERAKLQVRLQQTVEGLSVIAITYYLLGIISYGLKGLKDLGFHLSPEGLVGLLLPLVFLAVYLTGRYVQKRLHKP